MVIEIDRTEEGIWRGRFTAMACPCEILIDTESESEARACIETAAGEAIRIEQTYSRYRPGNAIHAINSAQGRAVEVDDELAALLSYADSCYRLSDGLFDISSGVLRRAWRFGGESRMPTAHEIADLLALVGWEKVSWRSPVIQLAAGMEIDLGGIGKEYAVDRALGLLNNAAPALINFGGDLAANRPRSDESPWRVAIENPLNMKAAPISIKLSQGAVATSGDSRRSIVLYGQRYSHILNPKTGWPVENAPRSVTVIAASCLEAGLFSTLAMLNGDRAEEFLLQQEVEHWVFR